jgi:type IV pilus assembly protein PilX
LNTTYLFSRSRQTGAALVTGLIFMLVLTIIVVSALRSATLEERMAANARNRQLALQAGEAALREAEAFINARGAPFDPFQPASFTADCANGLCTVPVSGGTPKWKTINWNDTANTRTFANAASNLDGVAVQPRYIIEIAGFPIPPAPGQPCNPVLYRVTARGVGMDNSEVFVQTMFRQRPDDNSSC